MKITVKNFGPIREAIDIEISPMTLFVGPSNTGKSYLAVLIYSIFSALENHGRQRFQPDKTDQEEKRYIDDVDELVESIFEEDSTSSKTRKIAGDLTESAFFRWANHIKKSLENQILYCFGEEGNNLLKNKKLSVVLSSNDDQIHVNIMSPSESKILNETKEMIGQDLFESIQIIFGEIDPESYEDSAPGDFCAEEFIALLWGRNSYIRGCHYLPAIRGGIMQSHRALVDTLIEQAPLTGLRKSPSAPMFTGVLADFMRKLIRLSEGENLRKKYYPRSLFGDDKYEKDEEKIISIGKLMESGIMQGEIEVRMTEMRYPDFRYKFSQNDEFHDLSLINTSSMVAELAPVSLFIRYYLEKEYFFIVEEPEAHLHPEGQREIANTLVQLANAGVFVLATTHSDNILEQVSNCVHAFKLGDAKLKAISENLPALDENHSSSYFFDKDIKNGTTVTKIPFSPTTGLITKDHLGVSSDLYNQTVGLLEAQDDD